MPEAIVEVVNKANDFLQRHSEIPIHLHLLPIVTPTNLTVKRLRRPNTYRHIKRAALLVSFPHLKILLVTQKR